ncbi:hypothetical protein GF327_08505 [Candidatus Woesearchaeota archaeon]|nr:hypothetical protein [Candidatus Woesearchaeota archaeon]
MKIKFIGEAGQGIKTMSLILGKILSEHGFFVSLSHDYGTGVRSGKITADLLFSRSKIENPKIEKPDFCIVLNKKNQKRLKKKKIFSRNLDFEKTAYEKFKNKKFANMIALGKFLRQIEIDIKKINLEKKLPEKYKKKNISALKYGHEIK